MSKNTNERAIESKRGHFAINVNEWMRITLHNAVVRLYNRRKPKSYRDSEWVMERAELYDLLMRLKRPDDPARLKYESERTIDKPEPS